MRPLHLYLLVAAATLALPFPSIAQETAPALRPQSCVGFSPLHNAWGWDWMKPIVKDAVCDPGYAVYEIDNPAPTRPHWFNCCPLPAADILEDVHQWEERSCPEGFVVTGLKALTPGTIARQLRCTHINTARYALGPRREGIAWGNARAAYFRMQINRLRKTEIPDTIVRSFGRMGLGHWDSSGCTGQPVGSLFVGGSGNACSSVEFQELFFKEVDSKTGESYPVKMYPRCAKRVDPFDPAPSCRE